MLGFIVAGCFLASGCGGSSGSSDSSSTTPGGTTTGASGNMAVTILSSGGTSTTYTFTSAHILHDWSFSGGIYSIVYANSISGFPSLTVNIDNTGLTAVLYLSATSYGSYSPAGSSFFPTGTKVTSLNWTGSQGVTGVLGSDLSSSHMTAITYP